MTEPDDNGPDELLKKLDDADNFKPVRKAACRDCGLFFYVGTSVYKGRLVPGISHELPMCNKYEKLTMTAFLYWQLFGKLPN